MRKDLCQHNEMNRILFGPPTNDYNLRPAEDLKDTAELETASLRRPSDFILPTVYWLDNAVSPSRVEVCVYSECAQGSKTRVRVLAVTGSPSSSQYGVGT
jgi:hypothetical protein